LPCRPLKIIADQRGISLLLILIMVAVIGLSAAVAGSTWQTIMQRSRESELLFRGDQYRRAIKSYVNAKQGGQTGQYPMELEHLLKDPRFPDNKKHIRQLYRDPMTGDEFEPIRAGGATIGPIRGVRSTSKKKPFKQDGFAKEYEKFKDAETYQDWEFVYEPPKPAGKQTPIGGQTPTGVLTPNSGAIPPAGPAPPTTQPFNPLLPPNQ